ncbi:CtsR family transcriptional regulator [Clostridium sp. HMP27]|uniref:CtsR family transcriptional regulator n=1 Tax=Clostridium sp. HMP27 TaxID=1487921 RepID=UPI00052C671C|nr:CtsR family transcriptional regulator [Clostridium sp. HMP27]KGK88980.1 CtsR family transcriptional regulator [Clostridium sp. HMP27]
MARLSDIIEEFIKQLLQDNDESELQIQRNELANYFRCAPSQINYVLTTRFTTDRGYYVESKRGGGGCIIIKHVDFNHNKKLMQAVNLQIGDSITFDKSVKIINYLQENDLVSEREAYIMKMAINDRSLNLLQENKNTFRAELLKSMLSVLSV